MVGDFLHGDPERPLLKDVEMKPWLCWRSGDVGNARAMGCLSKRAVQRARDKPKVEKCAAVNKTVRTKPPLTSVMPLRDLGFGVCPAGFISRFVPVFPHYDSFLSFRRYCIFSAIICWKYAICLLILQGYDQEMSLHHRYWPLSGAEL